MSGWTKERDRIRQTLVGKTGVRVLVVEGPDDLSFFESLLNRVAPGQWAALWAIDHANGKQNVLKILDNESTWLGIVDRDEWSDNAAIAARDASTRRGRLQVLPRFCMESYFIDPDEVWAALPAPQQAKVAGGKAVLAADMAASLSEWVRHGALWHAVNPLWDGLRALGFKEALLERQAAQSDAEIKRILGEWHAHLNPNPIFKEFEANVHRANATSTEEQLRKWVHGKKCFKEQVVPSLNNHLGQMSADDWMQSLRRTLPLPPDLGPLWQAMQLI